MSGQQMAMKLLDYRTYTMRLIGDLERAIRIETAELNDLLQHGELEGSANVCAVRENIKVFQDLLDEAKKLVGT